MNAKKHAQRARARQRKNLVELQAKYDEAMVILRRQRWQVEDLRREASNHKPFPLKTLQDEAAKQFGQMLAKSAYENNDMRRAIELQSRPPRFPTVRFEGSGSTSWEEDPRLMSMIVDHRVPSMGLRVSVDQLALEQMAEDEKRPHGDLSVVDRLDLEDAKREAELRMRRLKA